MCGFFIIIYPNLAKFINQKNQSSVIKGYIEKVEKMEENDIAKKKEIYEEYNDVSDKVDLIKEGEILGYIKIPKINLYLPIYEGTDSNVLLKGVGHIRGSGIPTKNKDYNCILAGHTGINTAKIFDNLTELELNDEFFITILNDDFKYKICDIEKITPSQTDNLKVQSNKSLVTLVTCTPKYVNSHRLLIIGEYIFNN